MEIENEIRGFFLIAETSLHAPAPSIKIYETEGSLKMDFVPDEKLWYGAKTDDSLQELKINSKEKGYWRVEEEFINAIYNVYFF